jgi:hypothetical protein
MDRQALHLRMAQVKAPDCVFRCIGRASAWPVLCRWWSARAPFTMVHGVRLCTHNGAAGDVGRNEDGAGRREERG